jgi:CHASE3 domain sensor protein
LPTSGWQKLGIGFVLVLLLTALVAGIGVWSLQTISHRFDGLKQMSLLNSGLLKVRLLEQEYALRGNPKTADALHEGVDGLIALATQLKAQSAANVPVMTDVEQSLGLTARLSTSSFRSVRPRTWRWKWPVGRCPAWPTTLMCCSPVWPMTAPIP